MALAPLLIAASVPFVMAGRRFVGYRMHTVRR